VSRASRVSLGILAFYGFTLILFGVTDMLNGVLSDPGITIALTGLTPAEVQAQDPIGYRLFDFTTRALGLALLAMGVLVTSTVLVPYRAGQRWAWAVLWTMPAWSGMVPILYLVFGVAPNTPPAPPMVFGPILGAVAAAALIVDRKRFAAGAPAGALEIARARA
jgi:hypothetical protein